MEVMEANSHRPCGLVIFCFCSERWEAVPAVAEEGWDVRDLVQNKTEVVA